MKNFLLLSLLTIFCFSCSDDEPEEDQTLPTNELELKGSYSGIFTVNYYNGNTISNEVTINFFEDAYSSTTGPDRIPAGGQGIYTISDDEITFQDSLYYTADFDWNLILAGAYEISHTETEIIIQKDREDIGLYEYRLQKNELISDNEYLIIGKYYGECLGSECVNIYKLTADSIYLAKDYPNGAVPFQGSFDYFCRPPQSRFSALIDAIPTELLTTASQTIGCPDCVDQGGFYVEYGKDNVLVGWKIDNDRGAVPEYLHEYLDLLDQFMEEVTGCL